LVSLNQHNVALIATSFAVAIAAATAGIAIFIHRYTKALQYSFSP